MNPASKRGGAAAQPSVAVVMPAYNEAARIGPTLEAIRRHEVERGDPLPVFLVDDGSTDRTTGVAWETAERVGLTLGHRLGGILAAEQSEVRHGQKDLRADELTQTCGRLADADIQQLGKRIDLELR